MKKSILSMFTIIIAVMFCFAIPGFMAATSASAQTAPTIAGCPVFPEDNVWNTPVDNLPLDPSSSSYVATIGATKGLHPDFGSGTWDGSPIGIPYNIVPGTQPEVTITFDYADESDPGPYPIPPGPAIEGGSQSAGDRHVLVLDQDNCVLYETWSTYSQPDGSWHAGSGAVFDLRSNVLRPGNWTSSDAAGLPILPGLVRYEEVASGEIRHALRFTAAQTRKEFIWPARHYASSLTGTQYPPMGQRFRLKSDFDISGFSPEVQVILNAFKKYGIILADNGSSWYISGVPDPRWNNDVLVNELRQVTGSYFEAVDESSLMINPDSGQAGQGAKYTYTLTVQRAGAGEVISTDGNINCGPVCSGFYASGTEVTLTAKPASGSVFFGWSGVCSGTSLTCTVTIDAAKAITAKFKDTLPPAGSVVINGGAVIVRSASVALTLAASDPSGVSSMCISNTSSCASWIVYAAKKSWTLTTGNGSKTVYAWFKDKLGNTNATPYTASIILDTFAPTNGNVTGAPGNGQVTLNWTGFVDTVSGVVTFKCVYSTSSAPTSCSTGTLIYAGPNTSYIHTGLTNGTTYYYRVCAIDGAGNMSSGVTAKTMPVPETNPPTGSISIKGGAIATRSASVSLALNVTDDSVGPIQMCISNTTSCTLWTTFAHTKTWTLIAGNGTKTVNVWFKDKWGNKNAAPYSDTIILDTTAPTNGTVTATPGNTQITLDWNVFTDNGSGLGSYVVRYATGSAPASCTAGSAVPGYNGAGNTFTHTGLTNGITYGYRVCAIDNAGNMSTGATAGTKPAP